MRDPPPISDNGYPALDGEPSHWLLFLEGEKTKLQLTKGPQRDKYLRPLQYVLKPPPFWMGNQSPGFLLLACGSLWQSLSLGCCLSGSWVVGNLHLARLLVSKWPIPRLQSIPQIQPVGRVRYPQRYPLIPHQSKPSIQTKGIYTYIRIYIYTHVYMYMYIYTSPGPSSKASNSARPEPSARRRARGAGEGLHRLGLRRLHRQRDGRREERAAVPKGKAGRPGFRQNAL